MAFAHWRDEKIERRGEHAEPRGHHKIAHGALDEVKVAHAHSQTDADDGAHERRYEHRADDDGCRVGVEAQRGYEDGQNKDEDIGAAKGHTVADGLLGFLLADEIVGQREVLYEILSESVGFNHFL